MPHEAALTFKMPLQRVLLCLLTLLSLGFHLTLDAVDARKEDVIEEVNAKQLGDIVENSDYVAVFWCK